MRIIDAHCHVFPEDVARHSVKTLASDAGVPLSNNGTITGLIACMQQDCIDYSVTLPVATKPSQVISINRWITANRNTHIINFGAMHPLFENQENELHFLKENDIVGIKLHPDYQSFYPNDRLIFPLYELCQSLDMIIVLHAGDDIGHQQPGHAIPRLFVPVMETFPRLRIIAAHMGGFLMWDQALEFLAGKDLWFDTSMCPGFAGDERMTALIHKHGHERILFGSDSPWGNARKQYERIMSMKLPDRQIENILWNNAQKLFGIEQ